MFQNWGDSIPVDPIRVGGSLGMVVEEKPLEPHVSGIIQKEPRGRPVVLLNVADGRRRKRFTCAHEIGHCVDWILDPERGGDPRGFTRADFRGPLAAEGTDPRERFANAFAAVLLMPDHHVEQRWAMGEDLMVMARFFDVSEEAMAYRLEGLGLVPPRQGLLDLG